MATPGRDFAGFSIATIPEQRLHDDLLVELLNRSGCASHPASRARLRRVRHAGGTQAVL
jgi:hypothetical protein